MPKGLHLRNASFFWRWKEYHGKESLGGKKLHINNGLYMGSAKKGVEGPSHSDMGCAEDDGSSCLSFNTRKVMHDKSKVQR